ncbi:MAG: TIGR04255 family protein [Deltaproteobacteria bacterium]|nr:TIGR04255 family protein [Deltaproteobacteria bacterium]
MKVPQKLGKPPLVEALVEVRFVAESPASDVLPGLLFSALRDEYASVKSLPVANLPRAMREQDIGLRYSPGYQLVGDKRTVNIGSRVLGVSCGMNYSGWGELRDAGRRAFDALLKTRLVTKIERVSLRYMNIIEPRAGASQISMIRARVEVLDQSPDDEGFHLRMENPDGEFLHIVQLATGAATSSKGVDVRRGLLIDIDTIKSIGDLPSIDDLMALFEAGHEKAKNVFFGLLTPETLKSLEPEGI